MGICEMAVLGAHISEKERAETTNEHEWTRIEDRVRTDTDQKGSNMFHISVHSCSFVVSIPSDRFVEVEDEAGEAGVGGKFGMIQALGDWCETNVQESIGSF